MTTTGITAERQAAYNAGHAATKEAIAILETTVDAETLRRFAIQNIIPVHVHCTDDYRNGTSDGWADWQSAQRLAGRQLANRRYHASRRQPR